MTESFLQQRTGNNARTFAGDEETLRVVGVHCSASQMINSGDAAAVLFEARDQSPPV